MPRFHHANLGVPVDGIADEAAFLTDVLGYRRLEPPPELRDRANWFEGDDGRQIHLSVDPDHRPAARAHVAVEFGPELAAIEARLAERSIEFEAAEGVQGRVVICRDPAGNRWELRSTTELAAP